MSHPIGSSLVAVHVEQIRRLARLYKCGWLAFGGVVRHRSGGAA